MPTLDNLVVIVPFIDLSGTIKLKKTGQTKSYNEHGNQVLNGSIKDDGYYQKGIISNYSRYAPGIVTDHITHLQWQDYYGYGYGYGNIVREEEWLEALNYCDNLSLDGGGWRLPTRKELLGIVDYGHRNPAINPIFHSTPSDYPNEFSGRYWSSTSLNNSEAWEVGFGTGYQAPSDKTYSNYVRCVRTY